MIKYNTTSLTGKIRDDVNSLIIKELKGYGIEDVAPSHGDILMCLYKVNNLSVKEIAKEIHRTQPTVTVLIDKLQRLGYVRRIKSQEDSRVSLVSLTTDGKE